MTDIFTTESFDSLGLSPSLVKTCASLGFEAPSTIQAKAIPVVLEGKDVIAQARTGSGKTAAFGLPALHLTENLGELSLLVITPTRELASQVCNELNRLGKNQKFEALAVFGGAPISGQVRKIRDGVQAVVATPGRLLDLLKSKKLKGFEPSLVVLDEADEMLDMGFLDDIKEIFSHFSNPRQTLLFSATMPKPIHDLAQMILKNPLTINTMGKSGIHHDIEEVYYLAKDKDKDRALFRLLDAHRPHKTIIFCNTKRDVERVFSSLQSQGYAARCLHGDMAQKERQHSIRSFSDSQCTLLVATDVAGRGLDVPDVSHVINMHIPFSKESYTHRIGRTGRAGKQGTAISLLTPGELRAISKILGKKREEMDLRTIPTKTELHQKLEAELGETLINQNPHHHAADLLKKLKQNLSSDEIATQALSQLLSQQKVAGPECIGLDPADIQSAPPSGKFSGNKRFSRGGGGGGKGRFSSRRPNRPGKPFSKGKGQGRRKPAYSGR